MPICLMLCCCYFQTNWYDMRVVLSELWEWLTLNTVGLPAHAFTDADCNAGIVNIHYYYVRIQVGGRLFICLAY